MFYFQVIGQISIEEPDSKTVAVYKDLVKKTLIGNGVLIGHFEVSAAPGAIGLFSLNGYDNLVDKGLVLSTGNVNDIQGPNDTTNTSTEFFTKGDEDLANLNGRLNGDAVSIEFDFIPFSDSVGFQYFFASEEYPEYVGKGFNDAFAFLIKGPGYPYYTNIANIKVGPRLIPISIDNINFLANSEHFITNHLSQDKKLIKQKAWRNELGDAEMLADIEFDGMTKKLRARAKVTRGEIYRFKIVIADVGDLRYDSGVFLEKESFGSPVASVASSDSLAMLKNFAFHYRNDPTKLTELKRIHPILVEKPLVDSLSFELYFAIDSSRILKEHIATIKAQLAKIKNIDDYTIYIVGHTDSTASDDYNLNLSKARRTSIAHYFIKNGVKIHKTDALGEKAPKYANSTEEGRTKNRRVEVTLIRKK